MINYPDCFHLIEKDVQRYLTVESGTKILLLPVLYTSLYLVYAVTVLDGTKSLFVLTAGGDNSSPSSITMDIV